MDDIQRAELKLRRAKEDALDEEQEVRFIQITTTDKGTIGLDACGRVWVLTLSLGHPSIPIGWKLVTMARIEEDIDPH